MRVQRAFCTAHLIALAAVVAIFAIPAAAAEDAQPAPRTYSARITTTHDAREEAPGVYSIRAEGNTGSRYIFYTTPADLQQGDELDALMSDAGTPDDPRDDYIIGLRTIGAAQAGNAYDRGRAEIDR